MEVIPLGYALGAEIRGIDITGAVSDNGGEGPEETDGGATDDTAAEDTAEQPGGEE